MGFPTFKLIHHKKAFLQTHLWKASISITKPNLNNTQLRISVSRFLKLGFFCEDFHCISVKTDIDQVEQWTAKLHNN